MSVVIVDYKMAAFGNQTSIQTPKKERALEGVVLPQLPVLADKLDLEEGQNEDTRDQGDATCNTKDSADGRYSSPVVKVKRRSALPDDIMVRMPDVRA